MNSGEKIKEARIKKGLTQKELANAANLSEIAIRKYEAGSRQPKIETLQKISIVLDVPLSHLRSDSDILAESTMNFLDYELKIIGTSIQEENALIDDFRCLNTDGKSEARKRVKELTEIKRYTEKKVPL